MRFVDDDELWIDRGKPIGLVTDATQALEAHEGCVALHTPEG
jgi:hypothetical protein